MSHEIDEFHDMDPIPSSPTRQFTSSVTFFQEQDVWEWKPYESERLPEKLASGIQRFLRVANLVESQEPRIAYLCRFHTFEVAHRIDSTSTGRGVRQFKTSLLERLEKDSNNDTLIRDAGSDTEELKRVYHAYKDYVIRHGAELNLDNSQREKLIDARRIAPVLYEVLKVVGGTTDDDYDSILESIESNQDDEETGKLLYMDESHKRNSNVELIIDECKALEDKRLTPISQGENHLTQAEIDAAIYKEEDQIKKDRPSSAVSSSSFYQDKYMETQEKLNKLEKKIEEMDLKLKDVDFWTSMMQNLFPDQMPPSVRANQIQNNNKLSL